MSGYHKKKLAGKIDIKQQVGHRKHHFTDTTNTVAALIWQKKMKRIFVTI